MSQVAVFIDGEPRSPVGGGIRSYIRLTTELLMQMGWKTRVYTHTPEAYPNQEVRLIDRVPWPSRPFRGLAYRVCHEQSVAFGTSLAICNALLREDNLQTHYEFCDYDGLAYHTLKNARLKKRAAVRIHTPLYLILRESAGKYSWLSRACLKYREKFAIKRAPYLTCPSTDFVLTHLSFAKRAEYIPNPLPTFIELEDVQSNRSQSFEPHFLFVGRREARKGVKELIMAFVACLVRHPEWRLTLVGEAADLKYEAKLRDLVLSLPIAQQKSFVFQKPYSGPKVELYRKHAIALLPSKWENAPYAYYEAIAAGIIALGSRTGDMGSIQPQTHGLNPKPGDVISWETTLESLWQQRDSASQWLLNQKKWREERHQLAHDLIVSHWSFRSKQG